MLLACVAVAACQRTAAHNGPSAAQKFPLVAEPGTSLASLRSIEPVPGTRLAISEHCSKICARSAPLACVGASECQSFCEELATSLECHPQMVAVLDCFGEQGTESWECAQQGLPALKEGHCSAEQVAYRTCRTASEPASADQP